MKESGDSPTLPYVSESLHGIGGVLRLRPEHFRVEEIPLYDASGEGEHLYVNISKVGRTSKSVQNDLGRLFGMKPSRVGLAGLKDKHAHTTQTFSVHVGIQGTEYAQQAADRIENDLGLQVNWARFHRNKLKTGHLLGNRFAILVADPECDLPECLNRCNLISAVLADRGLPNFFGPQRFGSDGDNVEQGISILHGNLQRREKWLRKFLVGSVQSHLCNVYLAERLRAGLFDRLLPGDVAKKYDTGGMFDVEDLAAEQDRYSAHEISFTAPIFGPKMWAAKGESGDLEAAILSSESLTVEDFGRARVNGTRRLGRLLLDDLTVAAQEDGILFRFSLPKGAYATTVLREYMKNDGEAAFAVDDDVYGETQL